MILSAVSLNNVSAESISEVEEKISEFEKEQQRLEEEQGNIGSDKQVTEGKIDENVSEQNSVTEELNLINDQLSETLSSIQTKETEITETNDEIETLSDRITKLKEDIEELKERIEKRDELLKDRLISIQKSGGSVKYIEVIFGSQSFGDFISRTLP